MELRVAGRRCRVATGQRDFTPAASRWPAIVLIHGAANDRDAWHAVAGGLTAAGCAVLAPDLPGHGLSEGPALASIEALADWLVQLLDAAGVGAAVVVGHSMGSLVALECAARHPQRVSRLALLGTSAPMPVSEVLLGRATSDPDAVYRLMTDYSLTGGFRLRGGDRPGVWGPGLTLAILRRSPPGALAIDLAGCNAYQNGLEAAARVACPTLLLVARHDRMTPRRNLPPLQSALREVTRVDIDDCGHALIAERPAAVIRALLDFLQPPPATPRAASPPNARER